MEFLLEYEEPESRENQEWFRFGIWGKEGEQGVAVNIDTAVQKKIKERFMDCDFELWQVILGKVRAMLKGRDSLPDDYENLPIENPSDPLDGGDITCVELFCHHLLGRDSSARCRISKSGQSVPNGCIPAKNSCWRQIIRPDVSAQGGEAV